MFPKAWQLAKALPKAGTNLVTLFHLACILVRYWIRRLRPTKTTRLGASVYRVYVFNESGDDTGFFREFPVSYFDPITWESDIGVWTGWRRFRVEVRYTYRSRKYRMVLRAGNPCPFPPYEEPEVPSFHLPSGVIAAKLQGPNGSGVETDVTRRVHKYRGPRGDFHEGLGLTVRLQDMFPFDDHDDNAARFSHLRVIDHWGRYRDLPYASNPEMLPWKRLPSDAAR